MSDSVLPGLVHLVQRAGRLGTATQLDLEAPALRSQRPTLRHWLVRVEDPRDRAATVPAWLAAVVHNDPVPQGEALGVSRPGRDTHRFALFGFRPDGPDWRPEAAVRRLATRGVAAVHAPAAVLYSFGVRDDAAALEIGEALLDTLLAGALPPPRTLQDAKRWQEAIRRAESLAAEGRQLVEARHSLLAGG